jgi:hypothetical protein
MLSDDYSSHGVVSLEEGLKSGLVKVLACGWNGLMKVVAF